MMWPFRSTRHPYPRPGPIRYMELLDELGNCALRETNASTLHHAGLITGDHFVKAVFAAREAEIDALRELRWTKEADRKQTDLDMRKGWRAEPLTELVEVDPVVVRQWFNPGAVDDA